MGELSFGVFDHLDRGNRPLQQFYEERLTIAEAYDKAGFYSYHVAEHHGTPLGMAPSPGIFLAAVARQTKRLRFGPAVYLLPLYHPIRLAEEVAMLDQLSGGRFDCGIGRGISSIEAQLYARDHSQAQERFDETVAIMKMAWETGEVNFEGKHYQFRDVPFEVRPIQTPVPLWYGISTVESAERCVERNFNAITLTTPEVTNTVVQRYRSAARAAGKDNLKVGTGRFLIVGETDEAALKIARRAFPVWHDSFHFLYHKYGRSPVHGERPRAYEGMIEQGLAIGGSVKTVTEAIRKEIEDSGANYFTCQFVFGDMTLEESLHSINLFTKEVMPAFAGTVAAVH
jgi:alkanesulfonate monooxygenase SsuD/methylene tetrahydromethanopterin reductase-like flavin-dependent oxidoreductase (luciferase family)